MTDETIFATALEKADPAERAAYLDAACAGDSDRRLRLARLLAAHDQASGFLGRPAVAPPDDAATLGLAGGEEEAFAFLAPPRRPDALGRIGHYEALELLGRGGFGIVFRAFDEVLQRVVAVKVLAPALAATSPARKRFLREARSSAAVRHDNVVQVYAVEEQPLPYLVMEFVPGETLEQRIARSGPLEAAEVARIGRQIAAGLAAAHARGLIHRDVKPGNVLIESGPQGRARLTDFGLARTADDASLSQSGVVAGTPLYMAPEQARGEPLDARADLFSLGSVLYALLTGHPPFRASGTLAVLKRVAEDTPRPIREIIPETPEPLCRIVEKLHARSLAERYQTAAEVAADLAEVERRLAAGLAWPDAPPPVRRRSGRPWLWATTLLVVAGAGVGLGFRSQWGAAPPPPPADPGLLPPRQRPALAVAPFPAPLARSHQQDWAAHLGVRVEITGPLGMRFRLIPPGVFTMGSSPAELDWLVRDAPDLKDAEAWLKAQLRNEGPDREVTIVEPFFLGTHEVTVGQFREFVRATDYRTEAETTGGGRVWNTATRRWVADPTHVWNNPKLSASESHPVAFMTPADARAFCAWLGTRDPRTFTLPTEEQWEYACRAGTTTRWSFGDDPVEMRQHGWTVERSLARLQGVGRLAANPFGLHDMHGNISELTSTPQQGWMERGGRAAESAWRARSAYRGPVHKADETHSQRGFRVAIVGALKK